MISYMTWNIRLQLGHKTQEQLPSAHRLPQTNIYIYNRERERRTLAAAWENCKLTKGVSQDQKHSGGARSMHTKDMSIIIQMGRTATHLGNTAGNTSRKYCGYVAQS